MIDKPTPAELLEQLRAIRAEAHAAADKVELLWNLAVTQLDRDGDGPGFTNPDVIKARTDARAAIRAHRDWLAGKAWRDMIYKTDTPPETDG